MKIQTKIKKVLFRKKGSNWSILSTEKGIFKGEIFWEPKENEIVDFTGNWEAYKGEKQFSFIMARTPIIIDSRELLKYACELTKGFGEAIENKIWDKFKENWKEIKKGDVKGLSDDKYNLFKDTIECLEYKKEETQAITYLMSKGCSLKLASKAWEKHEISTIAIMKANCYELANLSHIGFKQIDSNIRHNFGIKDGDISRIQAGIRYVIKELLSSGDSYVLLSNLQTNCLNLLSIGVEAIRDNIRELLSKKIIVGYPKHLAITLPEYKEYEENILNYINGI